jgi:hypothetical protein
MSQRQAFTAEFKHEAIRQLQTSGRPATVVAYGSACETVTKRVAAER